MNFPIVPEHRRDVLNINPDNKIKGEPFSMAPGVWTRIVVPVHAPFFAKSLKVYNANMQPLEMAVDGKKGDYRIYRIMGGLTELTAKPVACMIEFTNPDITGGFIDYDVVGEFSLFDSTFLKMVIDLVNDDRPVWWDNVTNKPKVFRPQLHPHSLLYDVVAFRDWVDLIQSIMNMMELNARTALQVKFDHFLDLLNHYINEYKTELLAGLNRHMDAYDSHGFTKLQAGLPLVDNYPTARGDELLQPRPDRHVTPGGIRTILDTYGFNPAELMESNQLPVSQFGNSNFIPANIDGSFEGLGGVIETGGMVLESDGVITILWSRMDGRTRGLYYSVIENATGSNVSVDFTGYKYEHAKINADDASADRIVQGSGDECILVGDSVKDLYYIGLTNGSNDPARHVYSKVNLRPLVEALFSNPANVPVSAIVPYLSIAMMADWVYIFLTASVNAPDPQPSLGGNWNYKHIFRVPISSIQATIDVTPTRQNVSFTDADGVTVNNSPWYRWYTLTRDGNGAVTKALYTFSPYPSNGYSGSYRSAITAVAEDPSRPGIYAVKFLTAYHAAFTSPTVNGAMSQVPEINYDFNPYTGVFTLKSQTPNFNINFGASPIVPPEYAATGQKTQLVFFYASQGLNVLEDGRVVSCGAYGFSGFPRGAFTLNLRNSATRHQTVSRLWNRGEDFTSPAGIPVAEKMISPVESSVCPRGFLYVPGGEYYVAGQRNDANRLGLYFKTVSGKFAYRPEIQNLYVGNIVSRPLTNNIRKVNSLPGLGGATVSVPSANLDFAGIEVGQSAFCVGFQKKHFDRDKAGTAWPGGVGANDVVLISQHTRRLETDGTITIVPTLEILYPEAIVNVIRAQVQFPGLIPVSKSVIVTICDPTFSPLAAFGWLPITASVQYTGQVGTGDQNTLFTTLVSIQPTYTDSGGRKVVTGFTVLNVTHWRSDSCAMNVPYAWGSGLTGDTPLSTMDPARIQYYLEGNKITMRHGCGVMAQTPGDAYAIDYVLDYADRTVSHNWSIVGPVGRSSNGYGVIMTPDNGIQYMRSWATSTGSAATISQGPVNHPLVGSVYPEVGWTIFFKTAIKVTFNGKLYLIPAGTIDLRDIVPNPANKTFYIYAILRSGVPSYEVAEDKRLETPFQVWVGRVITNTLQILTVERFNVVTLNGNRVSEIKRGNCIPASSGLANTEGQLPWLRNDELLP